jgi:heat shock protein HslJ
MKVDMKKAGSTVVLSILVIMVSACTGSSTTDLAGTDWVLTAFDGNSPIAGTQLTIEFEDGQVSGNTGCNLFSGSYQVDGDSISFSGLAWTERGCIDPEGVMEQERRYMELLGAAERFELGEDELKIYAGSSGSLTFGKPGDISSTSSQPSPVPPTATVEAPPPTEEIVFVPPSGFKEYRAESIDVSVYIPETWIEHTVVEGEYVILQSYPKDKYVGGEPFEPGDTKCDLGLRPEGENVTDLIDQWKADSMTTILSEEKVVLASGQSGMRIELDSMGRANAMITEIDGRIIVLTCFGDFTHFDEIAATLRASD